MKDRLLKLIKARLKEYQANSDRMGGRFNFLNQEDDDFYDPDDAVEFITEGDETIVRIAGPIDGFYGVDTRKIIRELDRINPGKLRLLIDSPGGYVDQGLALYTDLRARAVNGTSIATEARGIVASAASLIYLAGDERRLTLGSMLMIHPPAGYLDILMFGTADEIEQQAQPAVTRQIRDLRAIGDNLMEIYDDRLQINQEQLDQLIEDEQLLTATEAAALGFGQLVEEPEPGSGQSNDPEPEVNDPAVLAHYNRIVANLRTEVLAA